VLAATQGSLNWGTFTESLMGAVRTSAMIALILAGAAFLSLSMGFTGLAARARRPDRIAGIFRGSNS
jgi:C4-dicarboxylate transporter DctM subunit